MGKRKGKAIIYNLHRLGYEGVQNMYLHQTLERSGYATTMVLRNRIMSAEAALKRIKVVYYPNNIMEWLAYYAWHTLWLITPGKRLLFYGWDFKQRMASFVEWRSTGIRYYLEVKEPWVNSDRAAVECTYRTLKRSDNGYNHRWSNKRYLDYDYLLAPNEERAELGVEVYKSVKRTFVVHNAMPAGAPMVDRPPLSGRRLGLLYQGQINKYTIYSEFIKAIPALTDKYDVHIAGQISQEPDLCAEITEHLSKSGATYHGLLQPSRLSLLREKCDVGLVAWKATNYATRYAAPNKMYEYIASGMMVVSYPCESLSRFNDLHKIGVVLDSMSVDHIVDVLMSMKPEAVAKYGEKNYRLYVTTMNWEQQISEVARHMLGVRM